MEKLSLSQWLDGKKTYIMAVATICYALGGMVAGYVNPGVGIPLILGALGLGSVRHAVSKVLVNLWRTEQTE